MSYERMKQVEVELKAQIDALLALGMATDEDEVNDLRLVFEPFTTQEAT